VRRNTRRAAQATPRKAYEDEEPTAICNDLEVVAEAEVDGRVMYLQAEEGRLYGVTPDALVVFDPEGLETLETVEFERELGRRGLEQAEPSGLAVGEDSVYVTLAGEPFLVQIEKPQEGRTAEESET
jgi:hypothetical protein